jgi:hypothetical protein
MCELDLHVKEYVGDEPFYKCDGNTHYIMRGGDVLESLNLSSVKLWVANKTIQAKSVKSLLDSEGLDCSDYNGCIKFLSDTVIPKRNIKIYKDFLK